MVYQKIVNILKRGALVICFFMAPGYAAEELPESEIENIIEQAVRPVAKKYHIPGMAIAITINEKPYFYHYGVASKKTKKPITSKTLFEIGSISKTFTATLASYAEVKGQLSLSDKVSQYLPALRGSRFDEIRSCIQSVFRLLRSTVAR